MEFVVDEFAGNQSQVIRLEAVEGENSVSELSEPGDEFRRIEHHNEPLTCRFRLARHRKMGIPLKDFRPDVRGEKKQETGNVVGPGQNQSDRSWRRRIAGAFRPGPAASVAMKSLGHPYGLDVEVWDPDRVSSANIGRQLFAASEIGLNKAEALVNRYNLGFALNWKAHPERYHSNRGFDVLIACVDSRRSRKEIFQTLPKKNGPYVLDGGVLATCGQVIIGNGSKELPYPYQELPTLIDTRIKEKNLPSCSLAESLSIQELFVNQWLATAELELCWRLFRKGGLDYRGFYINLDTGRMNPVPID